ncbi:MAG: hypothetical protein V1921_06275 [Candidatus Altiarchaeota archaeon]
MTNTKIVKLKLDEEGGEKLPALKDPTVREVLGVYDGIQSSRESKSARYDHMLGAVKGFDVTETQLHDIVNALDGRQRTFDDKVKGGLFLTALAQNSSTNEFKIKVGTPYVAVGCKLGIGKKITVVGDLGEQTGREMDGGTVHVMGNAGQKTGNRMRRGMIIVEKDADTHLGYKMSGGKIHVKGNASVFAGCEMNGGEIEIDGDSAGDTGFCMQSGRLIVHKNVGLQTGGWTSGGTIVVDGEIGSVHEYHNKGEIIHKGVRIPPK